MWKVTHSGNLPRNKWHYDYKPQIFYSSLTLVNKAPSVKIIHIWIFLEIYLWAACRIHDNNGCCRKGCWPRFEAQIFFPRVWKLSVVACKHPYMIMWFITEPNGYLLSTHCRETNIRHISKQRLYSVYYYQSISSSHVYQSKHWKRKDRHIFEIKSLPDKIYDISISRYNRHQSMRWNRTVERASESTSWLMTNIGIEEWEDSKRGTIAKATSRENSDLNDSARSSIRSSDTVHCTTGTFATLATGWQRSRQLPSSKDRQSLTAWATLSKFFGFF